MNRLDRLTSLLTSLQTGRWKTSEQLASRFGISARTVYRDIRSLQEAGVPVICEAGRGYSIMEGYRLPPVMFTREEAVSLLAGEKLLSKQSSGQLKNDYHGAMEKVRAVLRGTDREFVEAIDSTLEVYHYPVKQHSLRHEQLFRDLQTAIFRHGVLSIHYFSPHSQQSTVREVEPLGLVQTGSYWCMAAWCRLREGYRSFRLDRVGKYEVTGETIPEPRSHTMDGYVANYRKGSGERVIIHFDREAVSYMGEQKFYYGWVSDRAVETGVEMTFLAESSEMMARWLLCWGRHARVIEPSSLDERVRHLVEALHEHYFPAVLS
jgi:predicted DNA-binding transcriptional regulator YafY